VEYAALEGYESGEGAKFFRSLKRMSEKAGSSIPSFLSTHPDPGEREATIQQMAAEWSQKVQMDRVEGDEFMAKVDDIVVGDDPRQGYTEGNVFYHPALKFQFPVPSGYQVINQPTQVALVESNQNAIMVFSIATDVNSAQAAGARFAGQEGITVVDQGGTRVNGMNAYDVLATATDEQGAQYQLVVRYIEYSGNIYSFLAYTTQSAYDNYRNGFYQSLDGFRQLTDQSKINVKPAYLDVITASSSGSFQSFLPANLPKGFTAEDVAILNQVNLGDTIPRGTKIKIPR
jgi:predicted Zn-dependent protease